MTYETLNQMTKEELETILKKYFTQISQYFAKKEYEAWVGYFGGEKIELTLTNLEKIFDKCWQLWDTHNDADTLQKIYGRSEGIDNLCDAYINKEALIKKINENNLVYSMHQYADYASFDFNLHNGTIEITYMVDDCCWDHLCDDLFDKELGNRETTLKGMSEVLKGL